MNRYMVRLRMLFSKPSAVTVVGRKEAVRVSEMPELGSIIAKIDSGAYSSSIHCPYVEEVIHKDKPNLLRFSPFEDKHRIYETPTYYMKKVTSSNGITEKRFVVEMHIELENKVLPVHVSLSNRAAMRYPMLIGRKFLREHNMLVNVTKRSYAK